MADADPLLLYPGEFPGQERSLHAGFIHDFLQDSVHIDPVGLLTGGIVNLDGARRRRGGRGFRPRIGQGAAALGDPVETALVGVFDITKIGSQAWTVGTKVYWDDTNKRCTTVATDNTLVGVATEAVASGAGDTIGRVRLNAAF